MLPAAGWTLLFEPEEFTLDPLAAAVGFLTTVFFLAAVFLGGSAWASSICLRASAAAAWAATNCSCWDLI